MNLACPVSHVGMPENQSQSAFRTHLRTGMPGSFFSHLSACSEVAGTVTRIGAEQQIPAYLAFKSACQAGRMASAPQRS
ncbi:Uncharacterized protein dnm_007570 [Desulfonema magnum]|uniref:Uncharacterized protein n=1 Tax=Desulfonema magnum TaxID=45655 RepID=A0A975BFW6_9BACT|nr:Uncharacterized protein dnm_007570 [Desulfonema magnum]